MTVISNVEDCRALMERIRVNPEAHRNAFLECKQLNIPLPEREITPDELWKNPLELRDKIILFAASLYRPES